MTGKEIIVLNGKRMIYCTNKDNTHSTQSTRVHTSALGAVMAPGQVKVTNS